MWHLIWALRSNCNSGSYHASGKVREAVLTKVLFYIVDFQISGIYYERRVTKTKSQQGIAPLIIVGLVAILLVGAGAVLSRREGGLKGFLKSPSEVAKQVNPTPYDELESALNKTVEEDSVYVDYKTAVTTSITSTANGITQTLKNHVDGYLTGSTDGKVSKGDLKIYSEEQKDLSVVISIISIENGDLYVKGPATNGKWQKLTKEEQDKMAEEEPTDASLYGFELVGSIFSENKALFKTIKKESVQKLDDLSQDGKNYKRFSVEIAIPDYIGAVENDPDNTPKEKKDAKVILQDSTINATFHVDKSTNYVTKLVIEAKNLTQIPTPEAERLQLSSKHDLHIEADLSRFGVPVDLNLPGPNDLVNPPPATQI